MKKAVIIGAGAGGMLAAHFLGNNDIKVTILERMDEPLKKIYATGNGKCNFTNLHLDKSCYTNMDDKTFNVITRFDNMAVMNYFLESGVPPYENNGYIYPHSRQATSIAGALINNVRSTGNVDIRTSCNVKAVDYADDKGFVVTYEENVAAKGEKNRFERKKEHCDYVIIAAGGKSSSVLGSDGSGTYLARRLGHKIVCEMPALCPLITFEDVKELKGVRVICKLNDEKGEIIFSEEGISGIPAFQVSSKIAGRLHDNEDVYIDVDFACDLHESVLKRALDYNFKHNPDNIYKGIVPDKLGKYIMKHNDCIDTYKAIDCLKMKFQVKAVAGFDKSQVTKGGVSLENVDLTTMESKIVKDMYFCGEVLDVDGKCGGYNLQWAFSSGYCAAMSIVEGAADDTDK